MLSQTDILALFQQLRGRSKEAQKSAAARLVTLALEAGGPTAILRAGADLPLLLARVNNGRTSNVRYWALHTLTKLTVPEEGRPAVAAAGAIPAVVDVLLNSSEQDMLLTAAGLLRNLAHDTDTWVPAMQDAGAFETLTHVLRRTSDSGVLQQVGSALCNATAFNLSPIKAAAAAACIAAGAHTQLLRHLSSGSLGAEAKDALAAATRALCNHVAGKAAVVEAGGLDVLARCLKDSSAGVQMEAAAAFVNLARGSEQYSSAVAAHPQALPALALLLHSSEAEVQATALAAFSNITWNSPSSSSALVASGALTGMVHVLQHSSDPEQLIDAAEQLAVLAARAQNARDAAVAAGAVAALQHLLSSTNSSICSAAAEALENLDAGEGGDEQEPPAKRSRRRR
ncbi:hypothetical protein COHA_004689 [Chlorella ohadii]|uniref:Vacuolar protein 8 n=1 Tax=Chlorella ohadii TaxID=2649997 RepID=A0AAD5H2D9_9CHLO|nr:hypothetical protein COHA_004689 [Chlorella ohadii]